MNAYCDECEVALLCVGGTITYLYVCETCGYCFLQVLGKSIVRDPERCKLPTTTKNTWCNACGKDIRADWYDKEGNVKKGLRI